MYPWFFRSMQSLFVINSMKDLLGNTFVVESMQGFVRADFLARLPYDERAQAEYETK